MLSINSFECIMSGSFLFHFISSTEECLKSAIYSYFSRIMKRWISSYSINTYNSFHVICWLYFCMGAMYYHWQPKDTRDKWIFNIWISETSLKLIHTLELEHIRYNQYSLYSFVTYNIYNRILKKMGVNRLDCISMILSWPFEMRGGGQNTFLSIFTVVCLECMQSCITALWTSGYINTWIWVYEKGKNN